MIALPLKSLHALLLFFFVSGLAFAADQLQPKGLGRVYVPAVEFQDRTASICDFLFPKPHTDAERYACYKTLLDCGTKEKADVCIMEATNKIMDKPAK